MTGHKRVNLDLGDFWVKQCHVELALGMCGIIIFKNLPPQKKAGHLWLTRVKTASYWSRVVQHCVIKLILTVSSVTGVDTLDCFHPLTPLPLKYLHSFIFIILYHQKPITP